MSTTPGTSCGKCGTPLDQAGLCCRCDYRPDACRHAGSVKWNPFKRAVACEVCGAVFYRAILTDEGYVLRSIDALEVDSEGLVEELAGELFRSVRTSGEWSVIEKPVFLKMARRGLNFLVQMARISAEKPSEPPAGQ